MSMSYIRRYYGVPAKRGGLVEWETSGGLRRGRIIRATNYIYVLFDGAPRAVPLHPCERGLRYLPDEKKGGAP